MDVTWLPKYAAAGWLYPLDEYFTSTDWNALSRGAQRGNGYLDKIKLWDYKFKQSNSSFLSSVS